jgi:hypothetical protein
MDHMNGNVAACGFYFDPSDYNRQAITNMDGRPSLYFTSCRSAPMLCSPCSWAATAGRQLAHFNDFVHACMCSSMRQS